MENELNDVTKLLDYISLVVKNNNEIIEATGQKFNMFNILGVSSNEVRLHSNFIAELLKPKGTHGLGSNFLELFLQEIKFSDFKCEDVSVEVEKYIGEVTDISGGRIDILIYNKQNQAIIIENKIYAQDQRNQLLRYNNYAKSRFYEKYIVLYLTLTPKEANDVFAKELNCFSITYDKHIISWIEESIKLATNKPFVRETLNQYSNLIKQLTGKSTSIKMNNQIIDILKKNQAYVEAAQKLSIALNEVSSIVRNDFLKKLEQKSNDTVELFDGNFLSFTYGDDQDGVFLGIRLKNEAGITIDQTELGQKYSDYLKEIYPRMYKNPGHIGWFCPQPFNRRERFLSKYNSEKIFEMFSDSQKLEDLVNELIAQREIIVDKFMKRIEKINI